LCLSLGIKHPNELNLTAWEIAEWDAYFQLHPFGPDVDHLMIAKVLGMFGNGNAAKHMPKVEANIDPDTAAANAYLQDLIRRGDC
jgi:hypothetical protein